MDRISSGREDDFDFSEELYESAKPLWKNRKQDVFWVPQKENKMRKSDAHTKWKNHQDLDNNVNADDDLNSLLKEEDDLVNAYWKQGEKTIDIVREKTQLLVEADQPGNQLDDYISRLNAILSQKAAGILQLQNRIAHFQRRLNENNVLVPSGHWFH